MFSPRRWGNYMPMCSLTWTAEDLRRMRTGSLTSWHESEPVCEPDRLELLGLSTTESKLPPPTNGSDQIQSGRGCGNFTCQNLPVVSSGRLLSLHRPSVKLLISVGNHFFVYHLFMLRYSNLLHITWMSNISACFRKCTAYHCVFFLWSECQDANILLCSHRPVPSASCRNWARICIVSSF